MIINGFILSVLTSYFIGRFIYRLFDSKETGIIAILIGWLMGIGATSLMFWLFTLGSNGQNSLYPFFEVFMVFALWLYYYKYIRKKSSHNNLFNFTTIEQNDYIAFILIFLVALMIVGYIKTFPSRGTWDSLMTWNLKAKFLANGNEGIWLRIFDNALEHSHRDYPLLWCCIIARGFLFAGCQSEIIPQLYCVFFLISCFILVYACLKKLKNSYYGIVGLLFMAFCTNIMQQNAKQYSDVILSIFIFVSIYEFAKWISDNENDTPVVCMIFSGLCVWIKNEGIPFWVVYSLLLLYKMRKRITWNIILCFIFAAIPSWFAREVIKCFCSSGNDLMGNVGVGLKNIFAIERYWTIFLYYCEIILQRHIWVIGLPFALFSSYRDKNFSKANLLAIIPVCGLMVYACVYLITMQDLSQHLPNSFPRIFVHYVPSFAFLISLFLALPIDSEIKQDTDSEK